MLIVTLLIALRLSIVTKLPFKIFPLLMLKVYFFNNLLPAQIGGDIYKFISLRPLLKGKTDTFSAIFSDRLLGVSGILLFSFINLILFSSYFDDNRVYYGFGLYLFVLLLILAVIFLTPEFNCDKLRNQWFKKVFGLLYNIKSDTGIYYGKNFILGIAITILAYFMLIIVNVAAMKVLNLKVIFMASFIYVPIISVAVISFPFSFNGLGVRESLYVLFFGMVGYTMEESIAMAFVNLFAIWIVSILGGLLVLISNEKVSNIKDIINA